MNSLAQQSDSRNVIGNRLISSPPAYDFRGDIDMLTKTFPGIGEVALQSFIDLANLNSCLPDQSDSSFPLAGGGLTGVVETFLNRSLNKKQQISNWEQRPLSFEQAVYAGMPMFSNC
jgi:hypothetical protein